MPLRFLKKYWKVEATNPSLNFKEQKNAQAGLLWR
jgi:hypothetical protein